MVFTKNAWLIIISTFVVMTLVLLMVGWVQGSRKSMDMIGASCLYFLRLGDLPGSGITVSGRIVSLTSCLLPVVAWAYYESIFTAYLTVNIPPIPKSFDEALVSSKFERLKFLRIVCMHHHIFFEGTKL